jgi:vitamin B12/bleomycin/antimicrobial peptide transport system ATP-binding/permease protein
MQKLKGGLLREAWLLAKPYWTSEERRRAWLLLAAIVALTLGSVYISVRLNQWRNTFFNALQDRDAVVFFQQLGVFTLLVTIDLFVIAYAFYLNQLLQIRWRRWLTEHFLGAWLDRQAFYRLQLADYGTDNPDQRISDDLRLFASYSLSLGLGLLNSVVSLGSFLVILWGLSGAADIPLGPLGTLHVPAYLVWTALLYAVFGTWLTVRLGRPLIGLNYNQQRYEADFRFSLVRLRENAEAVAFYGGEGREKGTFGERFRRVVDNWWALAKRRKNLLVYTTGINQAADIFPVVVASPRYFAQQIQLGGLMQITSAFGEVQTALLFIVNSYTDPGGGIAEWMAVVQRLAGFRAAIEKVRAELAGPQPIALARDGEGLDVDRLALDLPGGRRLLDAVSVSLEPGGSLLLVGPTGTGKSTLLRAIAGLWPFGEGRIRLGRGRAMFLPQHPYVPLGTLRNALLYPGEGEHAGDARLCAVLGEVGLAALGGELDEIDDWARRLSLGEQQRLAFARVLLAEPAIVFLDEATSALDEAGEAMLYRLLREAPWRPAIVSVGHRSTLRAFHDRVLDLAGARPAEAAAQ